jgi:hypothetical protein
MLSEWLTRDVCIFSCSTKYGPTYESYKAEMQNPPDSGDYWKGAESSLWVQFGLSDGLIWTTYVRIFI